MNTANNTVNVQIMGRSYTIKCPADKVIELQRSAHYLDAKMHEYLESGQNMGRERIAIMVALNLTHELLATEEESKHQAVLDQRLRQLNSKVSQGLNTPLEIAYTDE